MLASGGKILALGKVYHDETNLPIGPSLKGSGRPSDPLYVNEDWIIDKVNNKVSGASREWVEQNFQPSGDYVSATDFEKYKTEVQQEFDETVDWANDTFQPKNDYALKSDLKDWALSADVAKEFSATSAWANSAFQPKGEYQPAGDYITGDYKNEVSSAFSATSAWANDTFVTNNTFNTYSADIHNELEQKFYTSAFSASFSSAFNQEFNTYISSATSGWDHTEYSAGNGILINKHIISVDPSAVPFDNYYTRKETSGARQLSDEFDKYKQWSETSAWAEQTFIPQTASANWDLEKYSGFDGIKVDGHWIGISADYVTPQGLATALEPYAKTEALSAIPTLKSSDHSVAITSATSAGHVEYDLKVDKMPEIHISGERGISAQDLGDGNWLIGASADNLAYLNTTFVKTNAETVPSGSVIKFSGGVSKDITVDSDGYITIPDTVDKFTVCMNATIDGNIPRPDPHNYMLNQFVLSAVGGNELVRTHDYYPSEVGAGDSNIAATIQHYPNTKYCVVYEGSDALQWSNLNVHLTMLEEVMSLSNNSGTDIEYTGTLPINVNNQSRKIALEYDQDFFTLNEQNELTLAQSSSSGAQPVDPVLFNKLLNSINHRIVETLPIGIVNQTDNQGTGVVRSYLFRPMIEFDMNPGTTARVLTYQKDNGATVQVAVMEVTDEANGTLSPVWLSKEKTLDHGAGEHVLETHDDFKDTVNTILPEKLYYVAVITRAAHVGFIGISCGVAIDTGVCDIAYWDGNVNKVWNKSNMQEDRDNSNKLGSTGQANFKPYVGFRNP